jgi:hypothetical protein
MTIFQWLDLFQDILQIASIFGLLWGVWMFYKWTKRNLLRLQWSIPALICIAHNLIFYAYVQLADHLPLANGFFGFWSTVVRAHWIVVMLMTIWALNKLNGRVLK